MTVAAAAVTDGINNNAVALRNFAVDTKKPTATLTVQGRVPLRSGHYQRRGQRVLLHRLLRRGCQALRQ